MSRRMLIRQRGLALAALLSLGAGLLLAGLWIPAKAQLAQYLLDRAWNTTREGEHRVKPWPWADTWPIARLRLPGRADPLIVLAGASGRNLAFGPAHVGQTAIPGQPGLSIIAGHRDTSFESLPELKIGDDFEIERSNGRVYRYKVIARDIINGEHALVGLDTSKSFVMLVTCYPFDAVIPGGPLRYVVTGMAV